MRGVPQEGKRVNLEGASYPLAPNPLASAPERCPSRETSSNSVTAEIFPIAIRIGQLSSPGEIVKILACHE
jgi:hypothetical protein